MALADIFVSAWESMPQGLRPKLGSFPFCPFPLSLIKASQDPFLYHDAAEAWIK
jgi:hypothetical protein